MISKSDLAHWRHYALWEIDAQIEQDLVLSRILTEIFKLYTWWKEDRPKRPDPMEASGWSAYWDEKHRAAEEIKISCHIYVVS